MVDGSEEDNTLVGLVANLVAAQPPGPAEKHQRNIMDLHGLGKELWEGIDAQE